MWTWSRSAVVSFRPRLVSKWKSVLWSDESKFDIVVGNQVEGDLPACYHHSVRKPASQMVWGCISAYAMGSLHVLEGAMNAERHKGFRATNAPLKMTCIQQDNAKPHTSAITTAWLRSRRVRGAELACLQSRYFTYREHLVHHWMKNTSKMTTNSSAAGNLYQAIMEPTPKLQKLKPLLRFEFCGSVFL